MIYVYLELGQPKDKEIFRKDGAFYSLQKSSGKMYVRDVISLLDRRHNLLRLQTIGRMYMSCLHRSSVFS